MKKRKEFLMDFLYVVLCKHSSHSHEYVLYVLIASDENCPFSVIHTIRTATPIPPQLTQTYMYDFSHRNLFDGLVQVFTYIIK